MARDWRHRQAIPTGRVGLADFPMLAGELLLGALFENADVPSDQILVLRHRPAEPSLRRVLPWTVTERPDLFSAYQQIQGRAAARAMIRAKFVASFIGDAPGRGVFAGLYRVGSAMAISHDAYWAMPENRELAGYGMPGIALGAPDETMFELERLPTYAEWIGKLVVTWPTPERSWFRWTNRNRIAVRAILEENAFAKNMPTWDRLVLSWAEISVLPPSWRNALADWRGIYYIFDVARARGYVGSACSVDNMLGRWLNYAETGHGGNKRLRESRPEDLRFSILERTSPDANIAAVVELENRWKERLHTREFGLNEN